MPAINTSLESKETDPKELLRKLSADQKRRLLRELLADDLAKASYNRLHSAELSQAEEWLWNKMLEARSSRQKNSRVRIWLIFMLLRYGGLRLKEIFSLTEKDIDLESGILHVSACPYKRDAPLPLEVSQKMRQVWSNWYEPCINEFPLKCESSHVRRSLRECEKACNLSEGLVNARSMRRHRGREIETFGVHAWLADIFLGRMSPKNFERLEANRILKEVIQMEKTVKTSARNKFTGKICKLDKKGILVEVELETAQGLKVAAIITDASCAALGLALDKQVNAIIKAPWVTVLPESSKADGSAENIFPGTIGQIRSDALATEILVNLPQGNVLCAIYAQGRKPAPELVEGAAVVAKFSAFAVILTACPD